MKTILALLALFTLSNLSGRSGTIQTYSGTIEGTVLSESGFPGLDVGDNFSGYFEYFSDSVDGVYHSGFTEGDGTFVPGHGNLRGFIYWFRFPSTWPQGREGVFNFDASLSVDGGQVTDFHFNRFDDLSDYSFHGDEFTLSINDFQHQEASGRLTFGPIHTPETGSTIFFLALGCASLLAFRQNKGGLSFCDTKLISPVRKPCLAPFMKTILALLALFTLSNLSGRSGTIQTYSGTIEGTVLSESGDEFQVGDKILGRFKYFSDSVDGVYDSGWTESDGSFIPGHGNLRGSIFWDEFPSTWPFHKEGIAIGNAVLNVSGGQVTGFHFLRYNDYSQFYSSGDEFSLYDDSYFVPVRASGRLTFGPIHTPETGSTIFFLAIGCASMLMFRQNKAA